MHEIGAKMKWLRSTATLFIPVLAQNVTNKSCFACIKSEKYASWSPSHPSRTATAKAKPRYVYWISKPHGQSFRRQVRLLLSKGKLNYVYSIIKPHDQSSRNPVRPLLSMAKPSYVYSILKPHSQSYNSLSDNCHKRQS